MVYTVTQNKILQDKNGDVYVAEECFHNRISIVDSSHISSQACFVCSIYLTFGEVMQHQSQCSIVANQQLNVSNFA